MKFFRPINITISLKESHLMALLDGVKAELSTLSTKIDDLTNRVANAPPNPQDVADAAAIVTQLQTIEAKVDAIAQPPASP
jgi:hypothetical protein